MAAAAPLPVTDSNITRLSRQIAFAALVAAVGFAAFLTWRPFDIMFTLSDALFCIAALLLAMAGSLPQRPLGALTPWWLLAYCLMMAGLLLGSVVNGEPLRWAVAAAQYGFALVILPFLIVGHGEARTVILAKVMLAGLVVMEVFGIGVYFLSDGGFEDHQKIGLEFISGSRRLGVFLSDANWNGAFIAMALPFVIYLYNKRHIAGWQALLAGAILVEALLLAASVSALLCAISGVFMMMLIGGWRLPWQFMAAGTAGIIGYFAAGNPLPQAFSVRVAPAISGGDIAAAGTFSGRLDLMQEAWTMVGNTMVVGLGVDQYRVVSASGAPVHNLYLLLWTEGGLMALFGWLLLLAVLVAASALMLRRDRMTAALGLAVLTALVVSSIASPHMYARLWMVPIMVAMAFVFDQATMPQKDVR